MRSLALQDYQKPSLSALAAGLDPDPQSLDRFLRSVWVIEPDPLAYEYVVSPELQLELAERRWIFEGKPWYLAGDCDDAATLAGAIVSAWGLACNLVAIRQAHESEFSHVFLRVAAGRGFVDVDPIVTPAMLPLPSAETMEVELWQGI